jgi:hypothetical protein
MEQFHHPNGFDGGYHSARYSHNQFLSPHQADDDRQPPRRRNSTGRDYRSDDHLRPRIENEGGLRRARSSHRPTDPKSRDQGVANGGKKAVRDPVVEDYDSEDWDVARSKLQEPKNPRSRATRMPGLERPSIHRTYGEHELQTGPLPHNENLSNHSSHRAYSEHHVLASNFDPRGTSGDRSDAIASPIVHPNHVHVPNVKPRKTKKQKIPRQEVTQEEERSSPGPSQLHLSSRRHRSASQRPEFMSELIEPPDQQSRPALAGEHGYINDGTSSIPTQEADRPTPPRLSISLRPRAEARAQSYQGSSPSNPRPRLNTIESSPKPQIPRFSVSHDPPDLSQSINFSIGPGDSRSDTETTKRRTRLGSASTTTSTSFLSLPTSPPGSSVLGPKSYQYLPLGDMEFRLIRILPERMSR